MVSTGWNYADVWEWIAERFGDETALLHGSKETSWSDFDRRADGVARTLVDSGLEQQDKVAQYCRNKPEYLESTFAAFKAGLVPVNTNFRYGPSELAHLWSDSDTAAVVFDEEFAETCEQIRSRMRIKVWLCIGERCPDWAIPYEQAAADSSAEPHDHFRAAWGRSGDDLDLLYTGGTTGMPKGVMWRQNDLFQMVERQYGRRPPVECDLDGYLGRLEKVGPRVLPAPPLMHGTASWYSRAALDAAGSVVTLASRSFDPVELLDAAVSRRVKGLCIVGDAFARPIIKELDEHPGRWDLSGLRVIMSTGAMFSRECKERFIEIVRNVIVVDGLGTSESGTLGTSVATEPSKVGTARFSRSENVRVIDSDGNDIEPGSGEPGRLAVGGFLPVGYYKDPEKSSDTFITLRGQRYAVAGDWATVDADEMITLLGRGSNCINTAGEKVYPEEVEEALKRATGVRDAAVVGLPDERFGQVVIGVVELEPGTEFDEIALISHVKTSLAGYKAPKAVLRVDAIARHPNGKVNYVAAKMAAESEWHG
ncbi:MAG: AMP-binding protein [Acidimicrobiales bacterium]